MPIETIAAGPTATEVKGQEEVKQEHVEIKSEPAVPEVAPKITVSNEVKCFLTFLAHLSHWLMVSYCVRWMAVVHRLSSTISSNDFSS